MSFFSKLFGGGRSKGNDDRAMCQQQSQYEASLAESRRHNLEVEKLNLTQLDLQKQQLARVDEQRKLLDEKDKAAKAEEFAKKKASRMRGGRRRDLLSGSELGADDNLGGGLKLGG